MDLYNSSKKPLDDYWTNQQKGSVSFITNMELDSDETEMDKFLISFAWTDNLETSKVKLRLI